MITDPVYEGKSMAGLIDLVARGEIARDSNVLYAHLGGQPAINGVRLALRRGLSRGARSGRRADLSRPVPRAAQGSSG